MKSDLEHVIDRTAHIENILDQIILSYCMPSEERQRFFWQVILNSSIMSLASKVRVAAAIGQELDLNPDVAALHRVMALRNAFAHHATDAHGVFVVGTTKDEGHGQFELHVLSNSGTIMRMTRQEALSEFDVRFSDAKQSLVALKDATKMLYDR
jgi:hypothetical protein